MNLQVCWNCPVGIVRAVTLGVLAGVPVYFLTHKVLYAGIVAFVVAWLFTPVRDTDKSTTRHKGVASDLLKP